MRHTLLSILIGLGILSAGCAGEVSDEDLANADLALTARSAVDEYGLQWVKDGGAHVIRADIAIDAPVEVVWSLVRDPNHYADFSSAVSAHVEEMKVGAAISLNIQLCAPPFPPTNSQERVSLFDETLHAASWQRDFGFGQFTDRPQFVEAEGNGAHYYTALKNPGFIGWFVDGTLAPKIQAAFKQFAADLKAEAERRARGGK